MRWQQLRALEPRLAERGERLLGEPGVVLVATLRDDGSPRLSPTEPLFWRGDLWLSMMLGSRKARDLMRDPRILVHNVVTNRDGREGEFKVRGRALAQRDEQLQTDYAATVSRTLGWSPEVGRFHLFSVDIDDVTFIRYDPETGDQYVARWPDGREFVRRGTSATSLGPPEPHRELLRGPEA
ncbi:MAG: pyridoxamine 5'-phosphate oxidase family protein [Actinomycetota bacterium]|nr:pyridoxamine 5'-phosphate oxidase family protein [Actinomycetota bacterium]